MRNRALMIALACAATARAASYSTYIGDAHQYMVSAMAADANGNTYITGSRSVGPVLSPQYASPLVTDVFVCKLDPSGTLTLLATFSGKGNDVAKGIAVDASGNIYVVGSTTSIDFPLRNPLQSSVYSGSYLPGGSGFLMKLDPDGNLEYSTYLGGAQGSSSLNAVAADSAGNAYVVGMTTALDYPHTAGLPADMVNPSELEQISAAFFAKISADGSDIVYAGAMTAPNHECVGGSSCFLSSLYTMGMAGALDSAGNFYFIGNTNGGGLSTTSGALEPDGVGAFVVKINASGTALAYATYVGAGETEPGIGTIATDYVAAITADGEGNAYICGNTSDPAFPATSGAYQTKLINAGAPGASDAFIAKLSPAGNAIVWATYLGGSSTDGAANIALDPAGNVWVSGTTQSVDFPVTVTAESPTGSFTYPNGGEFVAELSSAGSSLVYSEIFPEATMAAALAIDSTGAVHAAGATGLISAFPAGVGPGQSASPWMLGITNAAGGALSGRAAPAELIAIYGLNSGPSSPAYGSFDAAGFLSTELGGVQVTINGIAAPLLYVSSNQVNAVAPVELIAGSAVELKVTNGGMPSSDFRLMVDTAIPQAFRSAAGAAAAINQDGTVNSPSDPAPVGSYVEVWATGTGYFPAPDGQMATAANEFCNSNLLYCRVYQSDGSPVNVYYSGAAPGAVTGVLQIDFQVTSSQSYYFSVGDVYSDSFSVFVQ